ncbi:MAG: hypothetical protein CSA81_13370 [Acidobacteria bacterium]|nr:MAG: hypothetical protein CSA81_13370 [Acidobacteriota bacterium]
MFIIDFIKAHKYKLGYIACLLAALGITYMSISASMSGLSGVTPNVSLHVFAFFATVALVIGAIYLKYQNDRQQNRR